MRSTPVAGRPHAHRSSSITDGRRVEGHRVAEPAPLGRVGGEHDRPPGAPRPSRWPQSGQADGEPGDPRDPIGPRPVGGDRRSAGSSPSSTTSLKEKGTDTMRPSNSGMATAIATSIGPSPASLEAHASWDDRRSHGLHDRHVELDQGGRVPADLVGRRARWPARWSPPRRLPVGAGGRAPRRAPRDPAASSSSRSPRRRPPAPRSRPHRSSTNWVFPESRWAR